MTKKTYMMFLASDSLADDIHTFIKQVDDNPKRIDHRLVNKIADNFISEMLKAFFIGPVDALNASGPMANVIHGISNVVSKAARGLSKRLLKKIDAEEQAGLADHFREICLDFPEGMRIGFLLDSAYAKDLTETFEKAKTGQVEQRKLESLMHKTTDYAISCFLDGSVAKLKTGRVTRGLIATARATIRKASGSATGHLMGVPAAERSPVLQYFLEMLVHPS